MDARNPETSTGAPPVLAQVAEPPSGGHLATPPPEEPPRRRWVLPVLLAPFVVLVLLVVAWVVDTTSGGVARNVQLAGVDIGGLSKDDLAGRVGDVASDVAARPVELVVGGSTYKTTAGALGLSVDETATASRALDVADGSMFLVRPFVWATTLVKQRDAPLVLRVSEDKLAATVIDLEGDHRTPPTEPTVELVDGTFRVVPGVDGKGIDPNEVARRLPAAAAAAVAADAGTIRVELEQRPIPPLGSEEAARRAAADAEALVNKPLVAHTRSGDRTISSDELRKWVRLKSNPDGTVVVSFDEASVAAGLRGAFADLDGSPVDASFTLANGVPVIRPDRPGLVCCGAGASTTILDALNSGEHSVTLELVQGPAAFTVADAKAYGIKQPVGGNNAWRNGAPTTAGPGFTTYHSPTGARVHNIHRIADLVRGVVIPPGKSFSVNDFVGVRTVEKGFVKAGAISNGEHVDEVGGGISQFATTTFNAAYFAGLQIDRYQAHSEWFDRYPRGREATMGYPAPDLEFTNNTPYGIMIWTSYTDTSLTITLYSTPYATAEQTGIVEHPSGACTAVTTTRTITYPDGHKKNDTFHAMYRPGPGKSC